ncbi:MAG: carbamoyl-phosphate synthase large subunit, partial [Bdellovibrionales bacterium]|nr:carbamoyl-phosphate synthase large subunit [Bdellovibrionales bacterium]
REILIEESLIGWKEMELEVMRDLKDNVVIVCSIENFDPMGVHTGDSITVAPIQTLTDKEYQRLRDAAIAIIRRIGVDTGGSNVQFAVNPKDGRIIVIEMNPRVSRSSALASKATGFPIAKIAAKLAVGYTLDELPNDITKETPACFEPSIDYVVVKIPRFNFEKFPLVDDTLGTQMKSVGEAMAFGRNFSEALQKALCSLELGSAGFDRGKKVKELGKGELLELISKPKPHRIWYVAEALRSGCTIEEVFAATGIDPWFISGMAQIVSVEEELKGAELAALGFEELNALKRQGFSDLRLSSLLGVKESEIAAKRKSLNVKPVYKTVDTCAAEFAAATPYLYSSYDGGSEGLPSGKKKIIILGSGPNRIGQGIEFDYCCVHAVLALQEDGYESIMVNCNPETVSTDYDISDRLYFEPLTFESVMEIVERENPDGVIVQFGGQTPLKLASALQAAGVPIIGTSVDSIDVAEDRKRFTELVDGLGLRQPENATATNRKEAFAAAEKIGYPLMIRPSFVLGGRAMRVVHDEKELQHYIEESVEVAEDKPVLLDRYLHNAIEVDVDAVSDGKTVFIAGVMEHIERAGIHSGDSSCSLPPQTLSKEIQLELRRQAKMLASALNVIGLMNVQFAVTKSGDIYLLEVNPRASRTVPFVSKATGIPWAKVAARVMAGKTLEELGVIEPADRPYVAIKACVFPFKKFAGVDTILGPEMKSTGEVMGIADCFGGGFAKAQYASSQTLPSGGRVFLSLMNQDKEGGLALVSELLELGFTAVATKGTASYFRENGFNVETVNKVKDGSPHIVDEISEGRIDLVINTPEGSNPLLDSRSIRLVANELNVPTFTTLAAAQAAVAAMWMIKENRAHSVKALQDYLLE